MAEFQEDGFQQLQLQFEALQADYNFVLSALKDEQRKNAALEEECDLLAEHNCRLEAEIVQLKKDKDTHIRVTVDRQQTTRLNGLSLADENSSMATGAFAQKAVMTIANAAGASNVLSVGLIPFHNVVVCGGVDKTLRLFDIHSGGEPIACYVFAAPVLAIDVFSPPIMKNTSASSDRVVALVGCSMMDGSHSIVTVRLSTLTATQSTNASIIAAEDASAGTIQQFHDHSKYVVCLRFSSDGRRFATCSYDKSVNLYGQVGCDDANQSGVGARFVKQISYRFQTTPESLVFVTVPSSSESAATDTADEVTPPPAAVGGIVDAMARNIGTNTTELVVALRDVSYLTYLTNLPVIQASLKTNVDVTTDAVGIDTDAIVGTSVATAPSEMIVIHHDANVASDRYHRKVSLNENEWDTHVSFTPLFLSTSPSGAFILVSTSHSMHYCYRTGTNNRVQTLTGHTSNEFSKPRTCWGSESVIYSNTEACGDIFVYFLHSARILHVIGGSDGHKGIVKDLVTHPSLPHTLVSGSFDKTVRVWTSCQE